MENGDIRSILVINVSRIGDTLLATPALRALAVAYPGARITCLAHPARAEILEHLPFLAGVGRIEKHRARLRGYLPGPRYDLAIVYGFDRQLVRYALRTAKRVVAYRQGDSAIDARLFRAVTAPIPGNCHLTELCFALLEPLGIAPSGLRLAYHVTDRERAWAQATLNRIAPKPCIRVGLQIASFPTKAFRDWPADQFVRLAQRMLVRWPECRFLLFGSAGDKSRNSQVAGQIGSSAISLAGKLKLRETASIMSLIDVYIGVDTGPTHIMSCFDVPCVALYHCVAPSKTVAPVDHPCFQVVDHPHGYPCNKETPMSDITVESVFGAVERSLGERCVH